MSRGKSFKIIFAFILVTCLMLQNVSTVFAEDIQTGNTEAKEIVSNEMMVAEEGAAQGEAQEANQNGLDVVEKANQNESNSNESAEAAANVSERSEDASASVPEKRMAALSPLGTIPLELKSGPKEVTPKIKKFELFNKHRKPIPGNTLGADEAFIFNLEWDAKEYGATLKEGDYFIVKIPDGFVFDSSQNLSFPLKATGGETMANAVATPGAENKGGTIKITFTKYVENRFDIEGSLSMFTKFNRKLVQIDKENIFEIAVGTFTETVKLKVGKPSMVGGDERLAKYAADKLDGKDNIIWFLRINYSKDPNLTNAVIKDRLEAVDGTGDLEGIHYLENSFYLTEASFGPDGKFTEISTPKNVKVKLNSDRTAFEYELGDIGNKQYRLAYRSTFKKGSGLKVRNHAELSNAGEKWVKEYVFTERGGSGIAVGKVALKIIKEDEKTGAKLEGAKFKVINNETNQEQVVTTNSQGFVLISNLTKGKKYTVQEIEAPYGYKLNSTPQSAILNEDLKSMVFKNELETIDISVEKKWIGRVGKNAEIKLLADGLEKSNVVMDKDSGWTHVFAGLPKYDLVKKEEINYSVSEVEMKGYKTTVSGNKVSGFVVTNKFKPTPTPSLPIEDTNKDNKDKQPDGDKSKDKPEQQKDNNPGKDGNNQDKENNKGKEDNKNNENKDKKDGEDTIKKGEVKENDKTINKSGKSPEDVLSIANTKNANKKAAENVLGESKMRTPKTGDQGNPALWFILMGASGLLLMALVLAKRKIKENK